MIITLQEKWGWRHTGNVIHDYYKVPTLSLIQGLNDVYYQKIYVHSIKIRPPVLPAGDETFVIRMHKFTFAIFDKNLT